MPLTSDAVIDALRPVQDPELHRSIVDLEMVRGVTIEGADVTVLIALTVAGCPLRAEITSRVVDALSPLDGVDRVKVDMTVMTPEELAGVREKVVELLDPGPRHRAVVRAPAPVLVSERARREVVVRQGVQRSERDVVAHVGRAAVDERYQ